MVKKPHYLNHLTFLALIGTSSETEIIAQAVGGKEVELNENLTGIQRNGSKFTATGRSRSMIYLER